MFVEQYHIHLHLMMQLLNCLNLLKYLSLRMSLQTFDEFCSLYFHYTTMKKIFVSLIYLLPIKNSNIELKISIKIEKYLLNQ
jgi:hypothetical protein